MNMVSLESEYRKPLNPSDIKRGVFIKKLTNIYLVKDFKKDISNKYKGRYRIDYYFRISTVTPTPQLHSNSFNIIDESDFNFKRIKKPTNKEIERLKSKIKQECHSFNFETLSYKEPKTKDQSQSDILTEEKYIDFLKEKGYLIFKQI